uniref:G-protein coupled receptors family 1 profile domain-containing protein n=1 Tax=Panagrolaimus sp. JU765 TaxID=591449 RepID=A0AC34QUE4_9BILA
MTLVPDLIRFLHKINGFVAFIVGVIGNILLIYFVWTHKSNVAKVYKRMLIQLAIIDLIFAVITVFIEPMSIVIEGNQYFIQNGFFTEMAHPWNHFLLMFWLSTFYFSFISVCIQYIFRYLVLCRNIQFSGKLYQTFFVFPFLVSVGLFWLFLHAYWPDPLSCFQINVLELAQIINNRKCSGFLMASRIKAANPLAKWVVIIAVLIVATNYSIIIFCTLKIRKSLKIAELSQQTQVLHKEMTKTLFVQAVSPLLVSMGPTLYAVFCIMFLQTAIESMILAIVFISWLPAINSFSTIFLIKQFRNRIFCLKPSATILESVNIGFFSRRLYTISSSHVA